MPRPPDDDPIGDAHALFRDDPPRREPAPKPRSTPAPSADEGGYDLIGGAPEPDLDAPVSPMPIPPARPAAARPKPRPRPGSEADAEPAASEFEPDPAGIAPARVDRPWSRWAEWGPTIRNLAVVVAAWLAALYIAMNGGAGLGMLFLIFVAGLAALIVLAYPIFITLERPVRMTPEQAVRDYFGALAHYRPHYRRMWLLLSSAGQDAREYRDFAGFQAYWKRNVARLRAGKAGGFSPLTVQVQDFRAEKSAGKSAIKAKFTVRIHVEKSPGTTEGTSVLMSREQLDELSRGAQLASYRMAIGLVRGPDNMWYLNDGALPAPEVG